jgi:hypothetical protein
MICVIIRLMKSPVILTSQIRSLCLIVFGFMSLSACHAISEPKVGQWSAPQFAGMPDAQKLNELSGLARSNLHKDIYWAHNDGGNPSEIIAIDSKARTKSITEIEGIQNIDWEDITSFQLNNDNYIAIADTGDNGGVRSDLFIHLIKEPNQLIETIKTPVVKTIQFKWPDGPRDSEALVADVKRQQFLLISKKRVPAELFGLPFDAKNGDSPILLATLEGISQPDEKTMNNKNDYGRYRAQITGADISPDGNWLAVLNYQQINFFYLPNGSIPKQLSPKLTITLPWLPQAEGIAFSQDGNSIFIGSEQSPTPLIRFSQIIH